MPLAKIYSPLSPGHVVSSSYACTALIKPASFGLFENNIPIHIEDFHTYSIQQVR